MCVCVCVCVCVRVYVFTCLPNRPNKTNYTYYILTHGVQLRQALMVFLDTLYPSHLSNSFGLDVNM